MKHLKQEERERTVIATADGEILSDTQTDKTKHIITKTFSPDKFVQTYVRDIADIYKIKSRPQVNLLLILCEEAKFLEESEEFSTFTALKDDKDRWADKLDLKRGKSIDNALTGLKQRNIIVQISRSKYIVNPKYFHYGALKDRDGLIELVIKYKQSTIDKIITK